VSSLDELISALTIFRKYGNPKYPTHCEHDELTICGIDPANVSAEDISRLEEMGFIVNDAEGCFYSFRYGSA